MLGSKLRFTASFPTWTATLEYVTLFTSDNMLNCPGLPSVNVTYGKSSFLVTASDKGQSMNFQSFPDTYSTSTDTYDSYVATPDDSQVAINWRGQADPFSTMGCLEYGPLGSTQMSQVVQYPLSSGSTISIIYPVFKIDAVTYPQCIVTSQYSLSVVDRATNLPVLLHDFVTMTVLTGTDGIAISILETAKMTAWGY